MATEHTYADPPRDGLTVGPPPQQQKRVAQSVGLGSGVESLAGIGAVTLTILGLAGVLPMLFAAIATIVIGGGLLLEGIAIAGSYAVQARENADYDARDESIVGGGMTAQTLGGAAGVTLGIIALATGASWTLLSVAAIVFGGTLLLSGPARTDLVNQRAIAHGHPVPPATAQAVKASASAMSLAGLGVLALGILAILSVGATPTLVLVAMLVTGGANLLGGSALMSRVATALH